VLLAKEKEAANASSKNGKVTNLLKANEHPTDH
jgi:hypothetical protein